MIKRIKASNFEKILLIFVILLAIFTLSSFYIIKNKCLFVTKHNPKNFIFKKPENIAILNTECGNVIIELYPAIAPKAVERFKTLIESGSYNNIAFHRVIPKVLVQAGDLEYGKKNKINYGKIGTGKSKLGPINSELMADFNFVRGSVGLVRTHEKNTEDSQFFILLIDAPLYEGEYTPVGKVINGIEVLDKVKFDRKSEYVLRPDFINIFKMYKK